MPETAKRGFQPSDRREFSPGALPLLRRAADDLRELLDRGYAAGPASAFVGDHYQLSLRQRLAAARTACSRADGARREEKRLSSLAGRDVSLDGFNAVIALETALSGGPVFRCMDGAWRDLAGLRGTYRLIGETDRALLLLLDALEAGGAASARFLLDRPVSNSGRLRARLLELSAGRKLPVSCETADGVDGLLSGLENVVTADSLILDRCQSWFNLPDVILPALPGAWLLDLTEKRPGPL